MMPKISVIVPVYRCEKYLAKCLNSILDQEFKDFELILICDGLEEDFSLCEHFLHKDSRISLIKNIRRGLGGARNAGIKAAKGEYISFIDADDWIEQKLFKNAVQILETTQADLVIFGVNVVGDALMEQRKDEIEYFKLKFENLQKISETIILGTNVSAWNKIYKRSLIEKYRISFPEKTEYEDFPFFFMYMLVAQKVFYLNEKFYNYFRHENCRMKKSFVDPCFKTIKDHIVGCDFLYGMLKENGLEKRYEDFFLKLYDLYVGTALRYMTKPIYDFAKETIEKRGFDINRIPLLKTGNKREILRYKLLGLTVFKICFQENIAVFKLFGIFPVIKTKTFNNKTRLYLMGIKLPGIIKGES